MSNLQVFIVFVLNTVIRSWTTLAYPLWVTHRPSIQGVLPTHDFVSSCLVYQHK